MLQQAARFLLRAEPSLVASLQQLSGCASASAPVATAGYATKAANPQDYSLVMKTAAEISSNIQKPLDREVGLTAGVPLQTFGRKVCFSCLQSSRVCHCSMQCNTLPDPIEAGAMLHTTYAYMMLHVLLGHFGPCLLTGTHLRIWQVPLPVRFGKDHSPVQCCTCMEDRV
jgi:hypothetical protein